MAEQNAFDKNSNYILSICIPTFNRRNYLEKAVESVLKIYNPEIEIIISDNCSEDDTKDYCENLIKQYPFIKYNRNKENLGPDRNFLTLFQLATGKYVQILSDDDEVRCKNIEKFLDFLRDEEFCLGELYSITNDGSPLHEINEQNRVYQEDEICDFIETCGINLTFVSALLFNKNYFLEVENPQQFVNSYLLQSHLAMAMLKFCKKTAMIYDYYCCATPNTSGGYNIYEIFVKNWKMVLCVTAAKSGISKKFLKKQFGRDLVFAKRYLVLEKRSGIKFRTDHKFRYFKYSFSYAYGIFVILPILLMPRFLVRFLYRIYKQIKR